MTRGSASGNNSCSLDLHIWPRLQAVATQVSRLVVVDASGRPRAVVSTRQTPDASAEVEVARADLAAILLDAAHDEAEIVLGDEITALSQDDGGVDVMFRQGSGRRFDLVLGADGLHSGVRRIAFGPEHHFAKPFGMLVGTMHTTLGGDTHDLQLFNRPGISLSIHPATGDPLAAFIFRSDQPYDHHDPDARKHLVESAYSGQGWLTDRAVAEWNHADDVYFDAVTRITMPTWTRGRISLLGDAADCISLLGEGSSNAIVGAKILSDALVTHPTDQGHALAQYEATQRRRLRSFQRKAGLNSHFLVPSTRLGLTVCNTGLRLASRLRWPQHRPEASR